MDSQLYATAYFNSRKLQKKKKVKIAWEKGVQIFDWSCIFEQ